MAIVKLLCSIQLLSNQDQIPKGMAFYPAFGRVRTLKRWLHKNFFSVVVEVQGPQSQTVHFHFRFMKWRRMIFCIIRPFSENLVLHNFSETILKVLNQFLHCMETKLFENRIFSTQISILWQNCNFGYLDFCILFFHQKWLRNNQWDT